MSDFGILRGTTATGVDMNGRRKKGTRRAKNPRDINNIAGELAKEKQIESCCEENEFTEEDLEQKTAPCWEGYEQIGMKKGKNGKMVPNCVPIKGKSAKPLRDPKGGLDWRCLQPHGVNQCRKTHLTQQRSQQKAVACLSDTRTQKKRQTLGLNLNKKHSDPLLAVAINRMPRETMMEMVS